MKKLGTKKTKSREGSILTNVKVFWLGLALFSLTLSAFVTSTVAWFNVSDILVVDNINMTYKNADFALGLKRKSDSAITLFEDGLKLDSLNDTELYSAAKKSDLLYPCSSSYGSSWMDEADPSSTLPTFRSAYAYPGYNLQTSDADFGYSQYEMYLYSDRDTYVFLDSSTSVTVAEGNNQVTAASRVSFYTDLGYTIYSPKKNGTTVFGGRLNVSGNDEYYDSVSGKEVLYGEYNSKDCSLIYDEAARSSDYEKGNCFKAKSQEGVEALDIDRSIKEGGLVIASEESYSLTDLLAPDYAVTSESHPIAFIPGDSYARIVMSIYLEGWDTSSIDSIQGAHFDLNIVFKGLAQPKISE